MHNVQMPRGYCGIGIIGCKTPKNLGGLWRSAHAFGAAFLFCIGPRWQRTHRRFASDTTNATVHIPYYRYESLEAFLDHRPHGSVLIAVEQTPESRALETFVHPRCALYVLGAEDTGIPPSVIAQCHATVAIETPVCLNVATAGSIVLYDRAQKAVDRRQHASTARYRTSP